MKRYITAALLFAAATAAACQFPSASVPGIEDTRRPAKNDGRGFNVPAGAILVTPDGEMYGSKHAIDTLNGIADTGGNVTGVTQTQLPDGTVVTQTTTTERTPGGGYVNTTVTTTDNGTTTTTVTDKTTVDSEGNVSQKTDSDTTTSQGGNQIYDPFDGEPEGSSTTTTTGTGKSPEEIKTEITTVTRYYDDGTKLEVRTETWTDLDGVIHTVVTKIYYDTDGKEIFRETATILETANADGSTTITAQIIRPPVFEAPDGTRFLLGTDGHLYILADPAADYYIRRVSIAGIHDAGNRQERTRHAQMLQEVDQLGRLTGISVIYNNGLETPGPFVPEIRLPVRYDPDPEDSTKMVVIPYASAELWLKHLPGGVETENCTWQLAGSLSAEDLQLYAVGAPLKIFGNIPLPANAAAGDEFILLLRLVDADGNASGEKITAGSNLPVITPPDKTVIVVGQDSDQLPGTGYSNSYVFRVKYSGRKALR